jgi:hypothetical protein
MNVLDCLENSWTDRIERFLIAQSVQKEAFHPVPQAHGIAKWSLFRVSRRSLERLSEKVLSNVPQVDSHVMRKANWVEKSLPSGP